MSPEPDAAGGQIQGARKRQEDAWVLERFADGGLLAVVADGLGGHPAGDVASREGIGRMQRTFIERVAEPDADPRECLRDAVVAADAHLMEMARQDPQLYGMATTMVALYLRGREFWAASVGDSYLLLRRGGQLVVLNELHAEGGGVTSCVGFHLSRIDLADQLEVAPGDRFVLSSDGIATLDTAEISGMVDAAADAEDAVSSLLQAVEEAGRPGQDNTTVVVVFPDGGAE